MRITNSMIRNNTSKNMSTTALKNMESILTDVYRQCVNGATDHLNESDRNTILTNLQKLREQVYAEGNAD